MTDTPLTPPQTAILRLLIDAGVIEEPDLVRGEKLSLWALERRGLAHAYGEGKWVATDTGVAWGLTQNGLLDVTVQCHHCGKVLAVAQPGSTVQVTCQCTGRLNRIVTPRVQREGRVPGQAVAAAAARIQAGKTNPQHDLILRLYAEAGQHGLTQPELERKRGVDTRAHRTRRNELSEAGYLVDSGGRRRIPHAGPSGRRGALAIIYRITPAALAALDES